MVFLLLLIDLQHQRDSCLRTSNPLIKRLVFGAHFLIDDLLEG